jgi:Cyclin
MVNTATQTTSPPAPSQTPTHRIAGLNIEDKEESPQDSETSSLSSEESESAEPLEPVATAPPDSRGKLARSVSHAKRHAEDYAHDTSERNAEHGQDSDDTPTKKARPEATEVRTVPQQYELCDTRDLVILISSMLMELIRYNDAIPLKDGHLTRFHSRAPPGISVHDYLQRLTTHATLSPPILLSMVYYIDRLCAMYPAFTITSLTVHRFLIASGTVASKGLSDSFWINKTYARVGGVSIKELALLELEFLMRLDWRIVPKPEVLCDYYVSLVKRSDTHKLEADAEAEENG